MSSTNSNQRYSTKSKKHSKKSQPNINSIIKEQKKESLYSVPLLNNIGDENSFFNSIIHMLHFTPEIFTYLDENKNNFSKNYEILSELYNILDKYEKLLDINQCYLIPEEERFIDVKNLRKKISELYQGEGLFQLGKADEPCEILYFFLNAMHSFSIDLISPKYYILETHHTELNNKLSSNTKNENNNENNNCNNTISEEEEDEEKKEDICDPVCLPHSLFNMHLLRQIECLNCNSSGNIKKFPNKFFIIDINYKNVSLNIKHIEKFKYLSNIFFRQAKKQFQFTNEICPKNCDSPKVLNRMYIMGVSNYLIFNINWKEIKPNLQDVCKCYFMIPRVLHNNELFDVIDKDLIADYMLYGFISYWNGHYISFYVNKYKEWYFYEDMRTRKMASWKEIITFCIKNHYHPIMLFYRKVDSKVALLDTQIVEKDFNEIMEYCKTVDSETLEKNNNINLNLSNYLRPTLQPDKAKDKNLIKTVENLQKLEEMKEKKQKIKYLDEAHDEKSSMVPEGINIFAGKWICNKCRNHNNISSYQCSKCQEINVKVFEIIYNAKNQKGTYRRNFKNNPSKFEILTKNFEKNYSNLIKIKLNLTQREDAYEKLKKMQEEEEIKLQTEMEKKMNENKIKFQVNEDGTWNCAYCGFYNENNKIDFCENCKWNKPLNNELIDNINDFNNFNILTSIKQF